MANLLQIHHEDGQGDDTFGRFGEPSVDFAQTALQFGQAEFPFDFHSLADVPVVLFSVRFVVLLGSAQGWSGQPDSSLLAKGQIVPIPVDFVRKDSFRVSSLSPGSAR